jgi:hypothetical protein
MFAWSWLADQGVPEGLPFALGHALAMKPCRSARPG